MQMLPRKLRECQGLPPLPVGVGYARRSLWLTPRKIRCHHLVVPGNFCCANTLPDPIERIFCARTVPGRVRRRSPPARGASESPCNPIWEKRERTFGECSFLRDLLGPILVGLVVLAQSGVVGVSVVIAVEGVGDIVAGFFSGRPFIVIVRLHQNADALVVIIFELLVR